MFQGTLAIVLAVAAAGLTGVAVVVAWVVGQRLSDRAAPPDSVPVGGWWMGLILIVPAWVWVTVFALTDRPELALGQLIGGQFYRLLVAMPVLMLAATVHLERSGSRWLLLGGMVFPLLLTLAGLDGWLGPIDGQLLVTITVVVFWVVLEEDHEGFRRVHGPDGGRSAPRRVPGRVMLPLAALAVVVALAAIAAILVSRVSSRVWMDRPVATTLLALAASWPAVPVALLMRRWWGVEASARGLLLANLLAPGLAFLPAAMIGQGVSYSLTLWRLDTWMLMLAALLPAPLLMRDHRFGRAEGIMLLVGYAFYLLVTWSIQA